MQVRSFVESDRKTIASWLTKRFIDSQLVEDLPKIGVVALANDRPVAFCFLRLVEGGFGLIDSLVTDKDAPSKLRHDAIEIIVKDIIFKAKELNLKSLIGYSIDTGTIERSQTHGFLKLPHGVISLDLRGKNS